ncbi:MAG: ATP-binding cassette domain-containing protein [Bacteroidota bacterium]
MSEELLKAIIRLLVIVAKEGNEVDESEKNSVRQFLYENVSREDTRVYLKLLDQYIEETNTGREGEDRKAIGQITDNINLELSQAQKLVVMVRLMELIIADEKITVRESELLYLIGDHLRFSHEVVDAIKQFVINRNPNNYSSKYSVVASGTYGEDKPRNIHLEGLKGHLAFFKIPKIEICFMKAYGGDIWTLNGFMISPNQIKIFSNGSSIKGRKTDRLYHSDVISVFREAISETHVSFTAEGIYYRFKNGQLGLEDVNIAEPTGQLFAIMGGSGAGKSTLFNVLSGSAKPSQGAIRINGIDIYKEPKRVEGVIGFVPQDDLLIEDLTVYQNLQYAARLCFDDATKKERSALVFKTLESLGLMEAKDLKVGNPLEKTISGGQRKRLNIGLELLREPSVLFVDEPTSGLSSRDSENIMDLLKELSLRGKMIFVVIHQPSSDIFKMFDKLLILDTGGKQIYYGNPVKAVTYFKNIVELIDRDQSACVECGNVNPEQIFNIIETKVVDEFGRFTIRRKYTPEQWQEHFQQRIEISKVTEESRALGKTLDIPSKAKQARIFLERDVLSKISNRQYVLINLLEAPVLAILLALITKYAPPGKNYTFLENENIPVFFFMSIIVALFMGLTVSAEEIIKDRKIQKRESFLHLSKFSYLSSKTLLLFALSALQTLLFVVIGCWILEIQGITIWFWLILFSISCFANILGLNISAGFNSVITVYILIPLLIIPQLLLSGVVVNFDRLNPAFADQERVPLIGEIMASRWAFEALTVVQFRDNPFNENFYPLDRKIAMNSYYSANLVAELQDRLERIQRAPESDQSAQDTQLLKKEIQKQLKVFGDDKFQRVEQVVFPMKPEVAKGAGDFLKAVRIVYNGRRKAAKMERDSLVEIRSSSVEQQSDLVKEKQQYTNEQIDYMVRNVGTRRRLVQKGDELIQKIYPVYARNDFPDHFFDFRTVLYYPEKYFAGLYIDTKIFNLLVIWSMTLFLFIAVYYDWLRKIVGGRRF